MSLEHLLSNLLSLEKVALNKESNDEGIKDERDLEYIKQSILGEIKKIDLQRLRSTRYISKTISDDEKFSLTVAQFMYKVDNLETKFKKSMKSIENWFTNFNQESKIENSADMISELKTQNKRLIEKIRDIENKCLSNQSLASSNYIASPSDSKGYERQIMCLKEIHATEIKHMQTSHDKIVHELKEMHSQKEQRLQERINLLSNHYGGEKDLRIVRTLQEALDKIRALTKPIYTQKIRDFPDFQILKNDRLEVTYVDFTAFLAKQAIAYMNKLEEYEPEDEQRYEEEDDDFNRSNSPPFQLNKQSPYPSVTNLFGHENNNVNFREDQNINNSNLRRSNSILSITDSDIQKALRVQNEFQRQHELLMREFSPDKMHMKENINTNIRTDSRQNEEANILSQRAASRKSIYTDVKDTIRSQRNLTFDEGAKFVTLSPDNFGDNLNQYNKKDAQSPNIHAMNIKSLQMSARITPRSNSTFKSKFGHLIKKRKI